MALAEVLLYNAHGHMIPQVVDGIDNKRAGLAVLGSKHTKCNSSNLTLIVIKHRGDSRPVLTVLSACLLLGGKLARLEGYCMYPMRRL